MTHVYVTRTGAKYHASETCPGILDAEARNGRPIERWAVPLKDLSQEPCVICWPMTHPWDVWTQLEHRVEQSGGTVYEQIFVRQVLRLVRDLRAYDVSVQRDAEGASGKRYRLDFAIHGEGDLRVAVEIDGKDKAPGERTTAEIERYVESRRADLLAAGWQVVNLANERVANHSAECVAELESALRTPLPPRRSDPRPSRPAQELTAAVPGPAGGIRPAPRWTRRRSAWIGVASAAGLAVGIGWFTLSSDNPSESRQPVGSECPASAPVKGNKSADGDLIFHQPGWSYYDRTTPEECFGSAAEAESAGYRPSEVK